MFEEIKEISSNLEQVSYLMDHKLVMGNKANSFNVLIEKYVDLIFENILVIFNIIKQENYFYKQRV